MNINVTELQIAIAFIFVTAVLVVWFRSKLASASRSRMYRMMARVGIYPRKSSRTGDKWGLDMNAARSRCKMCPAEDVCERWLAGEIEGDNGFCPNASVFDGIVRSA